MNPFASVLDDATNNNAILNDARRRLVIAASGDGVEKQVMFDDSDDGDDDSDSSASVGHTRRAKPPRPSTATLAGNNRLLAQQTASAKRRRRRSSARFIQLGRPSLPRVSRGSLAPSHAASNQENNDQERGNLSDLYQKAIRMNAENKINAGNSWNLRLIENIDTFLEGDEEDDALATPHALTPNATSSTQGANATTTKRRVNFTKASCTLDASIKIYGYRVDDVHLTSYKVLANLHRTETKKKPSASDGSEDVNDANEDNDAATEKQSRKKNASTLEANLGNINLNKLDSAFDIDPLFHKMSKTFDEGGAKGLLLVNLGVGESGCNIVFDSSNHNDESSEPAEPVGTTVRTAEGMVDVTTLTAKLESLLLDFDTRVHDDDSTDGHATIACIPLVPQLSSLRAEHARLEAGGFIDDSATALATTVGPKTPGKRRYHAADEEERLADYSIHKEAMERSSPLNTSRAAMRLFADSPNHLDATQEEDDGFVDFGGDAYDDGDDDQFDTFIATAGARYSDVSFGGANDPIAPAETSTSRVIDAIAAGTIVNNDYTYVVLNNTNHTSLLNGTVHARTNAWAGAAHWQRKGVGPVAQKDTKRKTKAKPKKVAPMVDVALNRTPDVSYLFEDSKKKSRTKSTSSKYSLSKAMITKWTNQENLLPADVGLQSVEQLTKLFLRPNAVLKEATTSVDETVSTPVGPEKTVGFLLPDWDDGDHDNDGPGFDFGDDHDYSQEGTDGDDFVVANLGVRKVAKVRVGYATVAKKVDVKRLKRDLWNQLESKFCPNGPRDDKDDMDNDTNEDDISNSNVANNAPAAVVTFQDTVHELSQQQSQADATLPFYFICMLHLANEKGLELSSTSMEHPLDNFSIVYPSVAAALNDD